MLLRPKATPLIHISEPHVRVTEWRFVPGAETGWHRHEADYVVVPLTDGDLLLEEPGGASRTATLNRHVLMRGARASSTMSSTPIHLISLSSRSSI